MPGQGDPRPNNRGRRRAAASDALKAAWHNGKEALSAGQARKVVRRMNRAGANVNAYQCEFCQRWHVGHVPPKRAERARRRREGCPCDDGD